MAWLNTQRRILLLLFAFMLLFSFAATGDMWIGWVRHAPVVLNYVCSADTAFARVQATMTTILAILIIIDFMFLDDSQFVFDPDVKESWPRSALAGYRDRAYAVYPLSTLFMFVTPLLCTPV